MVLNVCPTPSANWRIDFTVSASSGSE